MKKHSRRYVSALAVLFAISISLVFVAGCSQNAVEPVRDNAEQPMLGGSFYDLTGGDVTTEGDVDGFAVGDDTRVFASGIIGPKGGTIIIALPGFKATTFTFPRGALADKRLICIYAHVEAWPSGQTVVYECGPEGTVFAKPVAVTQNEPAGKTTASLYYFNPKSQMWELQQTAPVKAGFVTVYVNHFSKYGISR